MTQKMMRLFNNLTEARTYVRSETGWTIARTKQYVDNNITMRNGNKVWVVLP